MVRQVEQLSWYRKVTWNTLLLKTYWMACFVSTHLPKVPQAVGRVSDKTLHFGAYGVLAFLLSWVLAPRISGTLKHSFIVLAILAAYGVIDEVLQPAVGRSCDVRDWVADMIGATCGCAAFHIGQWLWRCFKKS